MNLATAFQQSAESHAGKTAVFWGEQEISYQAMLAESRRVATRLQRDMGIRPGDRVVVLLKNCPEFISVLFGIWQAGGIAVPVNNFLKPPELGYILDDSAASLLVTEPDFWETAGKLLRTHRQMRIVLVDEAVSEGQGNNGELSPAALSEKDVALIIYTSGTTGRSKGAMLTHGNLLHNVDSCRVVLSAVEFDRFALLLPMFHSFMLCVCIMLPLMVGGSIVLIKSLHPLKNVVQEILMRHATILPAIPQFFRTMVDAPLPELPLRLCVSGAAPLPVKVLKDFNAKFPFPLLEGYGLSEASPVVSLNPIRGPWKIGSIGVPIPNVEVSIQNDSGEFLSDGQVGEVCVRGGNVMQGYWNQPEATASALRNGWLLTGDVGYRDSDGYLYITDRKKDMILVNGINVYPREIEEVIYQFPGVQETAVVGEPDRRKGEQPVAFVVPRDGEQVHEHELLHFLRQNLADYKVPRRVLFLTTMPRNETGKILKTALRAGFISPNG
ncbi:MAG TPA: long-chain fatty acid--CoA ligase [Candidatus Paceibacterota bacterium]|nr:long-chain fatty acid--CoA ligase [Verrucomicrobiota bacterium]HRY46803.1 long-chain fatty acid--CoA ligase [Candidatus Paceibacterota bacterium]